MKDRIKEIRKQSPYGKTQDSFSDFLGIPKSNLASYEIGRRTPSDAVVQLICQKCNINEDWLRNGTLPMERYSDIDEYSEIATIIGETDPKAKQAIMKYWKLSDSDKELFWKFVDLITSKERG